MMRRRFCANGSLLKENESQEDLNKRMVFGDSLRIPFNKRLHNSIPPLSLAKSHSGTMAEWVHEENQHKAIGSTLVERKSMPNLLELPPKFGHQLPIVYELSLTMSHTDLAGVAEDFLDIPFDDEVLFDHDISTGSKHNTNNSFESDSFETSAALIQMKSQPISSTEDKKFAFKSQQHSVPIVVSDVKGQHFTSVREAKNMESMNHSGWTWDSVKKWWNSASQEACGKAERNLIETFVDTSVYEYKQRQVIINYDPGPLSAKQRKLRRTTSAYEEVPDYNAPLLRVRSAPVLHGPAMQSMSTPKYGRAQSENSRFNLISNENAISIHTVTFRVKESRLVKLTEHLQNHIDHHDDEDLKTPMNPDSEMEMDPNIVADTISLDELQTEIDDFKMMNHGPIRRQKIAPIVIAHGYGVDGGYIIPSIQTIFESLLSGMQLVESPQIHIIDWLGNGMSSRPKFECETTEEAEDWFVESLEAWRKAMGIEKMILCSHSLGGYCAVVYAMRYPQHVDHLIGISPAGISNQSYKLHRAPLGTKMLNGVVENLVNNRITPHDIVHDVDRTGKGLVEHFLVRHSIRLDDDTDTDTDTHALKPLLAEYLYHIMKLPASEEYAFKLIMKPDVGAHHPLEWRIGYLKQFQGAVTGNEQERENKSDSNDSIHSMNIEEASDTFSDLEYYSSTSSGDESDDTDLNPSELNDSLKIDFIYGEMDTTGQHHALKLKRESIIKCNVYINKYCGHSLIAENRKGFGRLMGGIIVKGQMNQTQKVSEPLTSPLRMGHQVSLGKLKTFTIEEAKQLPDHVLEEGFTVLDEDDICADDNEWNEDLKEELLQNWF